MGFCNGENLLVLISYRRISSIFLIDYKISLVASPSFLLNNYIVIQSHVVCMSSQEKNRTKDTEVAKIEKLISFVREPLLEKQREN